MTARTGDSINSEQPCWIHRQCIKGAYAADDTVHAKFGDAAARRLSPPPITPMAPLQKASAPPSLPLPVIPHHP
jgi:hypothetical protein